MYLYFIHIYFFDLNIYRIGKYFYIIYKMTIDIHSLLGKNPITRNILKPKFGYRYCGPYNNLDKQVDYNKNTGQIHKEYDKAKNKTDSICMNHDICYSIGKNKNDCDRVMVKEIDNIPFKEKPWGTFAIKQIINTKQKLGLGNNNNFNMEDLSEELNKPVINKFERKKVIVNHIDEIHSCDLVDMIKYSRMNKGYKYIFTNIDIFSKYAWSFPLKTKTIKDIKPCFEKIFKERKPKYIWSDQESAFFSKEMLKFFEDNNVKIYHTYSNLKSCHYRKI